MAIYFKENLINNTKNIIFFDIDGTFSSSIEVNLLMQDKNYKSFKREFYKNWETIKLVDFQHLNHNCIALFANLLHQTNSKAVCISSWNIKGISKPDLYLKELSQAFNIIFPYFPENWLLGFSGGSGGNRHINAIIPFIEQTQFKGQFIALDDGAFEYSDQSYSVLVNSKNGFDYNDYLKSLELFNMKKEIKFLNF